jgi:hypothetical protein
MPAERISACRKGRRGPAFLSIRVVRSDEQRAWLLVVCLVVRVRVEIIDRLAGGDVVDFFLFAGRCAPVLVVLVETADRTFLDRPAWTAFILALWFPFALGRGVGTEIAPGAAATPARTGVGRPGREAAGARSAESARACRARPWTAEAAPTAAAAVTARAWTRWTVLAGTCLADCKGPSFERLLIEPPDRLFRNGTIGVIDESESARPPGFPVDRKNDLRRCADTRQVFPQIYLICGVRQIANKQTDGHSPLFLSPAQHPGDTPAWFQKSPNKIARFTV